MERVPKKTCAQMKHTGLIDYARKTVGYMGGFGLKVLFGGKEARVSLCILYGALYVNHSHGLVLSSLPSTAQYSSEKNKLHVKQSSVAFRTPLSYEELRGRTLFKKSS